MARALELAARGQGSVEPNPMVGCVLVHEGTLVGEGFHTHFGGPHAELAALAAAGELAAGATAYVSLEPCCHHGKTPPCTEALIAAGVARVVAAMRDPFSQVAGGGIAALEAAGITCEVGMLADEAHWLNAPYLRLVADGRPWIIAKWAMTLDGKLATRTRDSKWISSEPSRAVVHQLRGRADAVIVGSGTARTDNPLLTARTADRADWKRTATRIVVDSHASLALESRLMQTARDVPVLIAAAQDAPREACEKLIAAGAEVLRCDGASNGERLASLFAELGRRRMTNVLVEGGSQLLGTLLDMRAIDEAHVFIAPKIVGGSEALSPIGGEGVSTIAASLRLTDIMVDVLDGDIYVRGRVKN